MPRMIDADALIKNTILNPCHAPYIVKQDVDNAPTVNGWISVKDRLPDGNGQYLCWFGKNILAKGAEIATYIKKWEVFGSLELFETYPNVTHWMPIEPPKEKS